MYTSPKGLYSICCIQYKGVLYYEDVACLNIADGCGLQTVAEAIRNIRLHSSWTFDYDKLWEELIELDDEFFLLRFRL